MYHEPAPAIASDVGPQGLPLSAAEAAARIRTFCYCGISDLGCRARAAWEAHRPATPDDKRCAACHCLAPCDASWAAREILRAESALRPLPEVGCRHLGVEPEPQRRFRFRWFGAT
jgi:hypothetical protein